jgi:hypothetical protein
VVCNADLVQGKPLELMINDAAAQRFGTRRRSSGEALPRTRMLEETLGRSTSTLRIKFRIIKT